MQKIKRLFLGLNIVLLSFLMTACGFHLRSSIELPEAFRAVYIDAQGGQGIFKQELLEQLSDSNSSVVGTRSEAGSVIRILSEKKTRRTLSLSRGGKSTEIELTYTVRYALFDRDETPLLSEQKLQKVRSYFNDQTDMLGKAGEEVLIYKEMRRQMADTLLRRLRAVLLAQ